MEYQPAVCRFCGKVFRSRSGLSDHERSHNKKAPYRCCNKIFFSRANLKRHRYAAFDRTGCIVSIYVATSETHRICCSTIGIKYECYIVWYSVFITSLTHFCNRRSNSFLWVPLFSSTSYKQLAGNKWNYHERAVKPK